MTDNAAKVKGRPADRPPTNRPSALTKPKMPSIPVTPKQSSLRVRFQHIPIDLTRAAGSGSQNDTDNESFLSILGSSSDEEYRPLHGNRTPQGSGQHSNNRYSCAGLWYVLALKKKVRV